MLCPRLGKVDLSKVFQINNHFSVSTLTDLLRLIFDDYRNGLNHHFVKKNVGRFFEGYYLSDIKIFCSGLRIADTHPTVERRSSFPEIS